MSKPATDNISSGQHSTTFMWSRSTLVDGHAMRMIRMRVHALSDSVLCVDRHNSNPPENWPHRLAGIWNETDVVEELFSGAKTVHLKNEVQRFMKKVEPEHVPDRIALNVNVQTTLNTILPQNITGRLTHFGQCFGQLRLQLLTLSVSMCLGVRKKRNQIRIAWTWFSRSSKTEFRTCEGKGFV